MADSYSLLFSGDQVGLIVRGKKVTRTNRALWSSTPTAYSQTELQLDSLEKAITEALIVSEWVCRVKYTTFRNYPKNELDT